MTSFTRKEAEEHLCDYALARIIEQFGEKKKYSYQELYLSPIGLMDFLACLGLSPAGCKAEKRLAFFVASKVQHLNLDPRVTNALLAAQACLAKPNENNRIDCIHAATDACYAAEDQPDTAAQAAAYAVSDACEAIARGQSVLNAVGMALEAMERASPEALSSFKAEIRAEAIRLLSPKSKAVS